MDNTVPSEHRQWGVEERVARLAGLAGFAGCKESESEEEEEDKVIDNLGGSFPDSEYPTPPVLEEQAPNDLP